MSSTTEEDLSRVTIISQSRRVDLALPGSVSLSELLPSILRFAGIDGNTPTEAVHAWVLQRFGADPLDLYVPVRQLSIRDGETLHLRQRENAIPDAAFDDVIDAVAATTRARPSWLPRHSRTLSLALMLGLLVAMPLLVTSSVRDERGLTLALALGITAFFSFATMIAAIALARAAGERHTASCLAWASVALAGITGWFIPILISDPAAALPLAINILMAAALSLVAAAAGALAARVQAMALFAAALTAAIVVMSGSVMALMPGHDIDVAAVTMAVMAVATTFLPALSHRLAGIALPNLPASTEAMLADETPVQVDIVARAVLADRILGALLSASTTAAVLSSFLVVRQGSVWALVLVLCIGLAFSLRARAFVGLTQRIALLASGAIITILGLVALAMIAITSPLGVVGVLASVLVLGYVFAHYSAATFGRILSPTWGRWGDVLEWLSIITIIPALLGVLDLYTYFGSLFG
ncbi:type VII secretion integral membrane protein EccD [Tessaracoccus antarcticus]|uniref:type VII secretion integral membrane protein EccD n=1 Tax=Tessaracoccus antarcticus TaxID=2479848 RepID=UPI0013146D0E|nr:type VII secretion integral membrane protein EccD [Tessaracoccus antarcticus]